MRNFHRPVVGALLVLGFVVAGASVHAASFDCHKAATRIERMICAAPDLNSYDSQLRAAYEGALDRSNHPADVKTSQLAWLKRRDACGEEKCLSALYSDRIAALSAIDDVPPGCPGDSTPEINACLGAYAKRADRELERYFAAARDLLSQPGDSESSESKAAREDALKGLESAQKSWEAYRKAECGALYDNWREGTIRGAMYQSCWRDVTEARTLAIWQTWLNYMDDTPPILPKPHKAPER